MKRILGLILPLACLWILTSCGSTKKIKTHPSTSSYPYPSASKAMSALLDHSFNIPFYVASFNVKAELDGKINTCSGQIRMKKDEYIWISLNKLGIEFARILVRPDSLHLLNRIDRTYASIPAFFLESLIGMNVDFDQVQHILISAISKPNSNEWVNPVDSADLFIFERKMKDYRPMTRLAISKNNAQIQYYDYTVPGKTKIVIKLSNYVDFQDCRMANQIVLETTGNLRNKLTITYTKRDSQEVEIPFSIPASYKQTTL